MRLQGSETWRHSFCSPTFMQTSAPRASSSLLGVAIAQSQERDSQNLTSFHPTGLFGNLYHGASHRFPAGFLLQPLLLTTPSVPAVSFWNGIHQPSCAMSQGAAGGRLLFEALPDLAQRLLQQIVLHSFHWSIAYLQSVGHPELE